MPLLMDITARFHWWSLAGTTAHPAVVSVSSYTLHTILLNPLHLLVSFNLHPSFSRILLLGHVSTYSSIYSPILSFLTVGYKTASVDNCSWNKCFLSLLVQVKSSLMFISSLHKCLLASLVTGNRWSSRDWLCNRISCHLISWRNTLISIGHWCSIEMLSRCSRDCSLLTCRSRLWTIH